MSWQVTTLISVVIVSAEAFIVGLAYIFTRYNKNG